MNQAMSKEEDVITAVSKVTGNPLLRGPPGYYTLSSIDVKDDPDSGSFLDFTKHLVTQEELDSPWPDKILVPGHPFKVVVDHFTYTDPCSTYEECVKIFKTMEAQDFNQKSYGIKYHFLIGGDGYIYEGRGFHICASKKLKKIKNMFRRRLDIAYIGDYTDKEIPPKMVRLFRMLIRFGENVKMIRENPYRLSIRKEDYENPRNIQMDFSKEKLGITGVTNANDINKATDDTLLT